MNKRIKELAVEAGFYANPDVEKFEKFAQLIVKECCRVMESLPPSTYHVGRSRMSEEIKQHFGVKE